MSTKAVFTMKLEPELRDTFMAEAAADDRPAAQVVRELMRDYINQRREAREYDEFCAARSRLRAGSVMLACTSQMRKWKPMRPPAVWTCYAAPERLDCESPLDSCGETGPGRHRGLHRGRKPTGGAQDGRSFQ